MNPIAIRNLNHAVLYVRDVERSVDFYTRAFGFEVVQRHGTQAAFLRSPIGDNHHDLGLFSVGAEAPSAPRGSVGLFHLAWEVPTIEDLASAREVLAELDALGGQSDHGATKSLYGSDPDGNEFEIMWSVPREDWGSYEHQAVVEPLQMERELQRYGAKTA